MLDLIVCRQMSFLEEFQILVEEGELLLAHAPSVTPMKFIAMVFSTQINAILIAL